MTCDAESFWLAWELPRSIAQLLYKRFSRKWQVVTGGDVNQYKTWRFAVANGSDIQTDTTGRAQDPNLLKYNNGLNYWHWQ